MPEPAAWPADRRITITDLQAATDRGERWSMLTSYDTLTAGVFEQAGVRAYRGEPRHPAYGASKAALNSFGQSMARALAPLGIAVASVAPGFVETAMARPDLDSARGEEIRAQSPFNRVATTKEIAAAVVYLASPEAEWASGAVLDLNGASYLR